jgi:hypothetical protein
VSRRAAGFCRILSRNAGILTRFCPPLRLRNSPEKAKSGSPISSIPQSWHLLTIFGGAWVPPIAPWKWRNPFVLPCGLALVTIHHKSKGRNRESGQESAGVFPRAVATRKRSDHRGLLGFGGRRVDDVPMGLPFPVTGDDCQWRVIASCFWPVGMVAFHAGYCTTRPPSTRRCASFHRFLCSQPLQRSKCSALGVKGASAGDGAEGSLRPSGPVV